VNISFHQQQLDLVDRLKKIMPSGLDCFFFWNGGADAVEASWKLARHATKKKNIIVMKGSYHGRTFATMGMTTSKTIYGAGFGPFVPGVYVSPFPYCLHCSSKGDECCGEAIYELEQVFRFSYDFCNVSQLFFVSPGTEAAERSQRYGCHHFGAHFGRGRVRSSASGISHQVERTLHQAQHSDDCR
jgi:4-aminobutyrate aminotransferase-like enzyme